MRDRRTDRVKPTISLCRGYNYLSILRLKLNHVSKRGPRIFASAMAPGWLILLQLNGMLINSLWPSDILWQQRSGSALAQVMACCLAAPSHYLNQCWLIISKVQWHSSEGNFTKDASATEISLKNYLSKISFKSPIFHWSIHPNMHPFKAHLIIKEATKGITMLYR